MPETNRAVEMSRVGNSAGDPAGVNQAETRAGPVESSPRRGRRKHAAVDGVDSAAVCRESHVMLEQPLHSGTLERPQHDPEPDVGAVDRAGARM